MHMLYIDFLVMAVLIGVVVPHCFFFLFAFL